MNKRWLIAAAVVCFSVTGLVAQSVLFDFDSAPAGSTLPIYLTVNGITAHFSGDPAWYNYSIQSAGVMGFTPAGFAGNCIYPSSVYLCDLLISFDRALSDASIMYSPQELATDSSCTMRITAYYGSRFVATNTYSIPTDQPATWPTGTLSIATSQPFTNLVIHYDKVPATGGDYGVIFMADNLVVTPWSAPYARIDSVTATVQGHTIITGVCVPFGTVTITATATLAQQFNYLGSAVAGGDGSFQFEDPDAASFPTRFYRVTYP